LPLGNTLYLLLSIYSSITLCLNQRFKDNTPILASFLFFFKTILLIFSSFLSWFKDNTPILASFLFFFKTILPIFSSLFFWFKTIQPRQSKLPDYPFILFFWFKDMGLTTKY